MSKKSYTEMYNHINKNLAEYTADIVDIRNENKDTIMPMGDIMIRLVMRELIKQQREEEANA